MKLIKHMSQIEIGAFVQSHLRKKGIDVVLSGGSSVSLYSENKYVSKDLDMINIRSIPRRKIREAMQEIGFFEKARYFFHPDSQYIIEFPPGPLTVGDEPVKDIIEIRFSTGILRTISPTDCVKDRLAAYFFWDDLQSLIQAILVAKNKDINIEELERWVISNNMLESFNKIRNKLIK